MKRILLFLLAGVGAILFGGFLYTRGAAITRVPVEGHVIPQAQPFVSSTREGVSSTRTEAMKKKKKTVAATSTVVSVLPEAVNLAVPFLSQAPKKDWGMPYQEACEEASLLMVDAFYRGKTTIGVEEGDRAILALVAWEESQTPSFPADLTIAQASEIAHAYFSEPVNSPKSVVGADDLKRVLASGHPIILPADGKALKNPNFHNGGPVYHMLVLKGYTADGFWITNDPGTRLGADYLYSQDVLLNAIHDWNGGAVPTGQKMVLMTAAPETK